jgi:hypothetical protein
MSNWWLGLAFAVSVRRVGGAVRFLHPASRGRVAGVRALLDQKDKPPRVTVRQFFRENGDAAICAMGVIIIGAATNYVWHSYLSVYVERQLHLPLSTALLGAFVSGVLNLFLFPLSGKLADRYGAYRLFYPIVITWMVCVYPLYHFVVTNPTPGHLFIAQMVATVFLAAMSGAHPRHARDAVSGAQPFGGRGAVVQHCGDAVRRHGAAHHHRLDASDRQQSDAAFYLIFAGFVSLAMVYFTRSGREPGGATAQFVTR